MLVTLYLQTENMFDKAKSAAVTHRSYYEIIDHICGIGVRRRYSVDSKHVLAEYAATTSAKGAKPMNTATATLNANLDKLTANDRRFAVSLLSSGNPSAKQLHWIGVLAEPPRRSRTAPPAKFRTSAASSR